MKVFGRRISNWWLAPILPLAVILFPLALMPVFLVNDLAGAILGPPAIWDRPWSTPPREELAGKYFETKRSLDEASTGGPAVIELKPDSSMTVANLPDELIDSGSKTCMVSGSGHWGGPDADAKIDVIVSPGHSEGTCPSGSYPYLEIAGHRPPYRLYWVFGDPDSGTGVWLEQRR